jgi:bifunctional non-homologous end joining protein LigD
VSLTIRAGRRAVEVSRPDKPLFSSGETKADLARYYERVAGAMLPHVAGRPLNLERYPDGIDGHRIIQQHASRHFPDWIGRIQVPKAGGTVEHVLADDAATLVYLAGQACITPHAWLSRRDRLERPDRMILDLDPSADSPADVRRAARELGGLLRELGLAPRALATGSRGFHIVVPLQRRQEFEAVRGFARDAARVAVARDPRRLTIEQRKARRGDRILVDVMRNSYAHTAVAPYAVRPRPKAPVATPLHWDELSEASTRPDRWTVSTLPRRLERDGDPWHDMDRERFALSAARRALDELVREIDRGG